MAALADRWGGRLGAVGAGCLTGFLVAIPVATVIGVASYLFLRSEAGNELLRARIEAVLEDLTPYGHVTIGRLETDLWNDLAVYDLRITDENGDTVVFVERALADVALGVISRKIIRLPHLRLDGVLFDLEMRKDGVLDLARVFGQLEPEEETNEPWQGLPVRLDLPDVLINGAHVRYRDSDGEVLRAVGVDARLSVRGKEVVELDDIELTGLLADPGPTAVAARAELTIDADGLLVDRLELDLPHSEATAYGRLGDTWDAHVDIERAHLPTLDPLIGEPGLIGTWAGSLDIEGDPDLLTISGPIRGVGGTIGAGDVTLTIDTQADPVRLSGDVRVADFHLHHLVPDVEEPVILNGGGPYVILAADWPEELVVDLRFDGGRQVAYGQEADALSGHFRIERGILSIRDGRVLGIAGDLGVAGTIDLVRGPMRLEVRGQLLPTYLDARGIEGIDRPGYADAVVTGDVFAFEEVAIGVSGTLDFAPFGYDDGAVTFRSMRARFATRVFNGDLVTGTAYVTARQGQAFGVAITEAVVPDLALYIPLGGGGTSTFVGHVTASGASMPNAFTIETATGPFRVTAPSGGELVVESELDVGAHEVLGFPGTGGRFDAVLAGNHATFGLALQQDERDTLVTNGTWDLATQDVRLETFVASPTPRATWRATRPITFTLVEGGVANADVSLVGELGTIELQGTVATRGPLDAVVHVEDLQLDTFAELYPDAASGLSGVLDLDATVSGVASNPTIDAAIDLRGLWIEDTVRWLDAEGRVVVEDGTLTPQLELAVAGDPLAVVYGDVPVVADLAAPGFAPSRPVDLVVAIRPGTFERFVNLSPALAEGDLPEGEVSAVLEARGILRDPDLRFAGVAEVTVPNWIDPARLEFDLRRDDGELVFWSDLREGFVQRASVTGEGATRMGDVIAWAVGGGPKPDLADAELWLDDMLVNGVLLGLPVADVASALDADVAVSGELTGGFTATGSPYQPVIEGGVHWLDARVGDLELTGAYVTLTPGAAGYDLAAAFDFAEEGGIAIEGTLPLRIDLRAGADTWTAGEMDLTIGGPGVPLEALSAFVPGVQDAHGLLVVEGTIGGPLGDPRPDFTARLEDGTVAVTPIGLRFEDVTLDLAADPALITLRTLRARTEPIRRRAFTGGFDGLANAASVITASGTARLEAWRPTDVEARLSLSEGAWVAATSETQLRMNGDLYASGTWPALGVSGALEVAQGNVLIDTASFLGGAPLTLDPSLIVHREGVEPTVPAPPKPSPISQFTVDVNLDVNRSLWLDLVMPWIDELGQLGQNVTQLEVETRLGGQLAAHMARGELVLVGEVEVVEGRASVLRSTFESLEGRVVYAGSEAGNPNLDLTATMTLPDATIQMFVRGTAERPQIAFASEEYPDETQILAILITGRAPDELTEEEGQAAVSSLAGLLLNSLFSGPSLGNFRIDPQGAVEVGVPVSSDLYATTRFAPTATLDENAIELVLEWSIGPRLVLSTGIGDKNVFADLFYEIRF